MRAAIAPSFFLSKSNDEWRNSREIRNIRNMKKFPDRKRVTISNFVARHSNFGGGEDPLNRLRPGQ
jgi:hypothetical protein